MRTGIVAMVVLGLALAMTDGLQARPPGGRGGGGGFRGAPGGGGRAGNGGGFDSGRPEQFGDGNFGGNAGERTFRTEGVGNRVEGGDFRGAVQQHLGVLPEPKVAKPRENGRAQYSQANKPFTADWYTSHPNAWQNTHPHADAWAAASLVGATAWLGWGTTPGYSYSSYYSETPPEAVVQEAAALAGNGTQEVPNDGEWLNLGAYTLAQSDQAQPTLMLSLTVNKEGVLRGTYFDMLSNSTAAIQGSIDKQSQLAAWRIGNDGPVTFQTSLRDLTSATTPVSLQFETGKTGIWKMIRQTQ
jgi:hypothetical protein